MKFIFLNEYGHLRSGWRASIFLITYLLLAGAFIFAATVLLAGLPIGPSIGSYLPITIPFAISTVIAIVLGWVYGKFFEGVPFKALGCSFRERWYLHFAAGIACGAFAITTAVVLAVVAGGLKLTNNNDSSSPAIWSTMWVTLIVFFIGALSEETLFRGYLLQTLTRSRQVFAGVAITSVLFGLAHTGNPEVGRLAILNTFLAGVWFAVAYLKTRDLWFPLGIHFIWNWMQGPVFGINVSGISDLSPDPIMRTADAGPAWLTGGKYGIEAGVACTFALVVFTILVYFIPWPQPTPEMLELTSKEDLGRLDLE
jgi:membrane protease YdiL (CAAX protease family)